MKCLNQGLKIASYTTSAQPYNASTVATTRIVSVTLEPINTAERDVFLEYDEGEILKHCTNSACRCEENDVRFLDNFIFLPKKVTSSTWFAGKTIHVGYAFLKIDDLETLKKELENVRFYAKSIKNDEKITKNDKKVVKK